MDRKETQRYIGIAARRIEKRNKRLLQRLLEDKHNMKDHPLREQVFRLSYDRGEQAGEEYAKLVDLLKNH